MRLEQKHDVFIKNVKAIYIEITAACNRDCVFCPNADGRRLPKNITKNYYKSNIKDNFSFPEEAYSELTAEIGHAGYKNSFGFHLYNEPLLDIDIFKSRLRIARLNLPNAKLTLNTNGDFLCEDLLRELHDLGLNHLHVSLYAPNKGSAYDFDQMSASVLSKAESLNLGGQALMRSARGVSYNVRVGGMSVKIDATNFNIVGVGYDRAAVISFLTKYKRQGNCTSPTDQILIDYNGNCLPCCNIHTSTPNYQQYILGNVLEQDLFDIYQNSKYQEWRHGCSFSPPIFDICKSCSRGDQK